MRKIFTIPTVLFATLVVSPFAGAGALNPLNILPELQLGSIAVVGPASEIISITRQGELITLRTCAEGTLKKDVERNGGCEPASQGVDVTLPSTDVFKVLFNQALNEIDVSKLSKEQKELVTRVTSADPSQISTEEREQIQARLDALLAQKADWGLNDDDSNQKKIGELSQKLNCPECKARGEAQVKMASVLKEILEQAVGSKIQKIYKHSEAQDQIVYQALKKMCTLSGFVDVKDPVSGDVGKLDLQTGRIWFSHEKNNVNWEKAKSYCSDKKQVLPTQADFKLAETHGIRDVFPEMKTEASNGNFRWFWSDTPAGFGYVYVINGYNGGAYYYYRDFRDDSVFVRCVSAAPRQ